MAAGKRDLLALFGWHSSAPAAPVSAPFNDGITDKDLRVWLVNGARTVRYPVYGWQSLSVDIGKFGNGKCSLVFGKNRPAFAGLIGSTLGFEFFEASIDVFLWDMTTPLFSGPTVAPNLAHQGSVASARGSLVAESFLQHALRRRVSHSATGATFTSTAKVDNVIKAIMNSAFGLLSPGGYPGGGSVSRSDFHSFTFTVAAATGSHPTTITFNEQSGGNVVDQCQRLCDQYDLSLTISESSAAHWSIDTAYPYQRNDKSASIILTPYRATMTAFEADTDMTSLANVWLVAGSGKGAAQVQSWAYDSTSVTNRGVFEDRMTSPDADAVSAGPADANYLKDQHKDPTVTYKVPIRQNSHHRFNLDYGVRDLVGIYDPVFARSESQLVVGASVKADAGGRLGVELVIKTPVTDGLRKMADMTGLPGGRSSGGRWKDKSSP